MLPEYWQAWGISHISRKSIPVYNHTHAKEILLMPSLTLPQQLFAVSTLPSVPRSKAWHLPLLPFTKPSSRLISPMPLLAGHAFGPVTSSVAILWMLPRILWGAELHTVFQLRLHRCSVCSRWSSCCCWWLKAPVHLVAYVSPLVHPETQ